MESDLKKHRFALVERFLRRRGTGWQWEQIAEQKQLLATLAGRSTHACCSVCASRIVIPLDWPDIHEDGEHGVAFVPHPGCVGQLVVKETMRIAWQRQERFLVFCFDPHYLQEAVGNGADER